MKANINTMHGIEEVEIEKKPFKVQGVLLFVHKQKEGDYVVTEWQSGWGLTSVQYKRDIRPAIKRVFEKISLERIKERIKEAIEEHGIANEGILGEDKQ